MLILQEIHNRTEWNTALRAFPHAHILQTWEWGEFKRVTTGWHPLRWVFKQNNEILGMVSLGVRSVAGLKLMYAPKGFVTHFDQPTIVHHILQHLEQYARRNPTVWLKIDPDVVLATGLPNTEEDTPNADGTRFQHMLQEHGWHFSDDQVQFRNTLALDLTQSEDDLLANMSQNTRRKVRTGEKKGVTIRVATLDDLPILYALYQQTGERDAFLIRPFTYYQRAWRDFMQAGLAHALIAEHEGQAIAHVILFHFGRKCWYFYGASSNTARDTMPNYALQWEAMRWAKTNGYTVYDMWGAPNVFAESDSMWGVYEFKRGFRGVVTRHIGAYDFAPYRPLYWGYTQAIPKIRARLRPKTISE